MDTSIVVAVIAAAAAVTSAVFTWKSSKRATDSGERVALRQVEAGAYERARQMYEGALTRMQAEIDRQARQILDLQRQLARLVRQMRAAGLEPVTSSEEEQP